MEEITLTAVATMEEITLTSEERSELILYRAVGLNEAHDIEQFGGFRPAPQSFQEGKWFATTREDAAEWGRRMPPVSRSRPFRIVLCRVPPGIVELLEHRARLDTIGPAYFAPANLLSILNAVGDVSLEAAEFARERTNE